MERWGSGKVEKGRDRNGEVGRWGDGDGNREMGRGDSEKKMARWGCGLMEREMVMEMEKWGDGDGGRWRGGDGGGDGGKRHSTASLRRSAYSKRRASP